MVEKDKTKKQDDTMIEFRVAMTSSRPKPIMLA